MLRLCESRYRICGRLTVARGGVQMRVGNARGSEIYNAHLRLTYNRVSFDEFGVPFIAEEELKLVESSKSCMRYVHDAFGA